jgi:hypothetical protein
MHIRTVKAVCIPEVINHPQACVSNKQPMRCSLNMYCVRSVSNERGNEISRLVSSSDDELCVRDGTGVGWSSGY